MDLEGGHFATESEVVTDAEIAELLEGETNEEGDGERQLELV
jgi:hypothetical protein